MPRRSLSFIPKTLIPWLLVAGLIWHEWKGENLPKTPTPPPQEIHHPVTASVCFTPGGDCAQAVVKAIDSAKKSVEVQAYSFTSAPIAKALVEAHRRGIDVQVILDKSNETEKYSSADFLSRAGIPVHIDADHAIAHNKVMVIDDQTVITGSFNFTKAAQERNAENLLILQDPALAQFYRNNWKVHEGHSKSF